MSGKKRHFPDGPSCVCCGRTVVWVRRKDGGSIAVDPGYIPIDVDEGEETFVTDGGELVYGRRVSPEGQRFAAENGETLERGRVPHWVTCGKIVNVNRFR